MRSGTGEWQPLLPRLEFVDLLFNGCKPLREVHSLVQRVNLAVEPPDFRVYCSELTVDLGFQSLNLGLQPINLTLKPIEPSIDGFDLSL